MVASMFSDVHWFWILCIASSAGCVGICLVAWCFRAPPDTLGVAIVRCLCRMNLRVVHCFPKLTDPLPPDGPVILVANHRSGIDPPVLAIHTNRHIRFMMAREYYQIGFLNWLYRSLKTIPVKRDGRDLAATKEALRALHSGDVIGIFPEGEMRESGLSSDNGLDGEPVATNNVDVKSGAALLALKTGVPVVTAYIEGTPAHDSVFRAFLTPSRSRVSFGAPIVLAEKPGRRPSKAQVKEATHVIVNDLLSLRTYDSQVCDGTEKEARAPMTESES